MNWEELSRVLQRPIAFHRIFSDIGGGALNGLFLSQAFYWTKITKDPDGFFWKTQEEWEEETGITRYEQETIRRSLRSRGIIEEEKRGIPCKIYFRINKHNLLELLDKATTTGGSSQVCGNSQVKSATTKAIKNKGDELPFPLEEPLQTSLGEYHNQESAITTDKDVVNQQTNTETTTETTPETTTTDMSDFEKVWEAYHTVRRKVSNKKTTEDRCKAIVARKEASWDQLVMAAKRYSEACDKLGTEPRFIQHAEVFFGESKGQWRNAIRENFVEEYLDANKQRAGQQTFFGADRQNPRVLKNVDPGFIKGLTDKFGND